MPRSRRQFLTDTVTLLGAAATDVLLPARLIPTPLRDGGVHVVNRS